MAEFGLFIAEQLIAVTGSQLIKEICDGWGYKTHLEELNETVSTVQKVLLDAEARRDLSNNERDYVIKLKDAVYDADDLFDELLTLAELNQLRPKHGKGQLYEKYSWMNMDSRVVVVQLNEIVNAPNGIRLTLHRNEPMTSVYDRVASITGITLSALRVGVQGRVIDTQGMVIDTIIRNEDIMWWMEYSGNLKFW